MQHILDHVVGPDVKNVMSNLRRQMAISQMPGKTHELIGILMPHLDERRSIVRPSYHSRHTIVFRSSTRTGFSPSKAD